MNKEDGVESESQPEAPVKKRGDLDTRIGAKNGIKPGRKKGSKNKSTLLREALTNNFEEQLTKSFHKVVEVVIEQAIDGCRQSQKLLLDRVVPTVHAENEKDKKNPFSGGVTINIGTMGSTLTLKEEDIEEATYEDITE